MNWKATAIRGGFLLCLALCLVGTAEARSVAEGELRRGWIEIRGPVQESLLFDIGSREVLRIDLRLLQGETRRFDLVLPRNGGLDPIGLDGEAPEVRFGGFVDLSPALPPGLRVRATRPPLQMGERGRAAMRPPAAWIGLAATLFLTLVLATRGRPWSAAALGIAGALGLVVLGSVEPLDPPRLRIEEGVAGEELRLRVDSGLGRLSLPVDAPESYRVDVYPVTAAALWTLSESSSGEPRLRIEAPGARINLRSTRLVAEEPSAERLSGLSFSEIWTRDARGAWAFRGPWPEGEPLPAAPSDRDPRGRRVRRALPTWLVSGLPQGQTVLVARQAMLPEPGSAAGGGSRGEQRWLRLTDFDLP